MGRTRGFSALVEAEREARDEYLALRGGVKAR